MKRILISFTDEQAKELSKQINMSQTVRNAVDIYNEHISTDTVQGLRQSYQALKNYQKEKFEYYDECFARLDKLINMLETRM